MSKVLLSSLAAVAALGLLMAILTAPQGSVAAMGAAPSTCVNLYDSTITAASVSYPGGSLYPLAHPNSTITVRHTDNYTLMFTIRSDANSTAGKTLPGSIWYNDDWLGFANGVCVDVSGPGQDVTATEVIAHPPNLANQTVESVYLGTWSTTNTPPEVNFIVDWVNPQQSTSSGSVTRSTTITSTDSTSTQQAATPTLTQSSNSTTILPVSVSYTSTITIHNTTNFQSPSSSSSTSVSTSTTYSSISLPSVTSTITISPSFVTTSPATSSSSASASRSSTATITTPQVVSSSSGIGASPTVSSSQVASNPGTGLPTNTTILLVAVGVILVVVVATFAVVRMRGRAAATPARGTP